VIKCDLLRDKLPDIAAAVVIVDPPWYDEYMKAFLWAAKTLSNENSYVLMSVPPIGTRPGVEKELKALVLWMKQSLGFTLMHVDEGVLPYQSPTFERNALRAEGLANILSEWRRGDLWIMKTSAAGVNLIPRPTPPQIETYWHENVIDNVRFKVRLIEHDTQCFDPSLRTIVEEDILPTVSRRDARRHSVDLWTSGNRVFATASAQLLHVIIRALSVGNRPNDQLASLLKRKLAPGEELQILSIVDHLRQIISTENKEYDRYAEAE
jgi:hypothetical protein